MTMMPADEWFQLLSSWSKELLSTTDRIHYLIGNSHQPTKGSYREELLRKLLRRILPNRFRVSTGFIYRWDEPPSQQIDILIWDAQQHSALLEEGEFVILTANSVDAIIEVKSTLNSKELNDALDLLYPTWLVNWRYRAEDSLTGLHQQYDNLPFRAIFAYTDNRTNSVPCIFSDLTKFYRTRFGQDVENVLAHSSLNASNSKWSNMINAICIADGPYIEQEIVNIECDNSAYRVPGFVAYEGQHAIGENISVGRFCMDLLFHLTGSIVGEAARMTLRSPKSIVDKGVYCCKEIPSQLRHIKVGGREIKCEDVYLSSPPLWN